MSFYVAATYYIIILHIIMVYFSAYLHTSKCFTSVKIPLPKLSVTVFSKKIFKVAPNLPINLGAIHRCITLLLIGFRLCFSL